MTRISAERIAAIEARREELQQAMSAGEVPTDQFVQLSKDYAEIEPVAAAAREVRRLRDEAASLEQMTHEADEELRQMAAD
jgi:peptide chain release factor 1